jgi:hypothetical protein
VLRVGCPMLKSLSKEIRDCHARAEACEDKARRAFTEEMREDFLQLRDSWLKLARSYEFTEQLLDFSRENACLRTKWWSPKSGEHKSGEHKSGEHKSGEHKSGEHKSGDNKLCDKPITKPGDTPLKPRDKLFKWSA